MAALWEERCTAENTAWDAQTYTRWCEEQGIVYECLLCIWLISLSLWCYKSLQNLVYLTLVSSLLLLVQLGDWVGAWKWGGVQNKWGHATDDAMESPVMYDFKAKQRKLTSYTKALFPTSVRKLSQQTLYKEMQTQKINPKLNAFLLLFLCKNKKVGQGKTHHRIRLLTDDTAPKVA